jgi:hypothetical protein
MTNITTRHRERQWENLLHAHINEWKWTNGDINRLTAEEMKLIKSTEGYTKEEGIRNE